MRSGVGSKHQQQVQPPLLPWDRAQQLEISLESIRAVASQKVKFPSNTQGLIDVETRIFLLFWQESADPFSIWSGQNSFTTGGRCGSMLVLHRPPLHCNTHHELTYEHLGQFTPHYFTKQTSSKPEGTAA